MPQKTSQSGWWQRVFYQQFGFLLRISFVLHSQVSEDADKKKRRVTTPEKLSDAVKKAHSK